MKNNNNISYAIGSRVTHKSFKWLKDTGTVIDIEDSIEIPFLTASDIYTEPRYKVRWDKWGESGWIDEDDLKLKGKNE